MFGALKTALGGIESNVLDRAAHTAVPDAGAFLQDWVTTKLPEAVVGLATRIGGREDGSGFLANEAIKMGTDQHIGAIFK